MARRIRQFFVAIVDDDVGLRKATEDLLNSIGFRTRGFSSAEQFLRSKDGRNAGCLVLDMRLPGMSGLALQRELRAKGVFTPIIIITAEDDAVSQLRAQISRVDVIAVLHKPFDPDELSRLVQVAFEAQRLP